MRALLIHQGVFEHTDNIKIKPTAYFIMQTDGNNTDIIRMNGIRLGNRI